MSETAVLAQREVRAAFPGLTLSYSEPPAPIITVAPACSDFGAIEILDGEFEFTVYCGRFTHAHVANQDDGILSHKPSERVVERLLEFLTDLFTDRLESWGSHGGGCALRRVSFRGSSEA
jgi:hypothetical protein